MGFGDGGPAVREQNRSFSPGLADDVERGGEMVGAAGREHEAVPAIFDELGSAAAIRHDHGFAGTQGGDERRRDGIVIGRHRQHVDCGKEGVKRPGRNE
jgi:hypothetical protein